MKEMTPLKDIVVKHNGQDVKILRQEILDNPTLSILLLAYERATNEIAEAEYQLRKAAHAKRSMEQELKEKMLKYVIDTRFAATEKTDGENESE